MKKFKNAQWRWIVMFFAITLSTGMTACKDDNDSDDEEDNSEIIGTWADMEDLDSGNPQVFCIRINEDLTTSQMLWDTESDTFKYAYSDEPYTARLVKEGNRWLAYDYDVGVRHECTFTVSNGYLYDTHAEDGDVFVYKKVR